MSETTTSAPVVEIKFRDDLIETRDKIKAEFVADNAGGILTLPAGTYFKNAPEGVTEESYALHRGWDDLFNNATTAAASEVAVDMFKDNKELQTVALTVPIYKKDTYEGVFKRQGTSRNVKSGEVSNYVGSIGVGRINTVSTRTQTEWQGIKSNMRALAEAAGL